MRKSLGDATCFLLLAELRLGLTRQPVAGLGGELLHNSVSLQHGDHPLLPSASVLQQDVDPTVRSSLGVSKEHQEEQSAAFHPVQTWQRLLGSTRKL
jgi:hypothetical protein